MSLLEIKIKPVPDEDIYKNSTGGGVFTSLQPVGKLPPLVEKKKEEIDKDQMKVFGMILMVRKLSE